MFHYLCESCGADVEIEEIELDYCDHFMSDQCQDCYDGEEKD